MARLLWVILPAFAVLGIGVWKLLSVGAPDPQIVERAASLHDPDAATPGALSLPSGEAPSGTRRALSEGANPTALEGDAAVDLHPLILGIEGGFLIGDRRFSELDLDRMSLDELDDVVRQIRAYQVGEQAAFFERLDLRHAPRMPESEYIESQLWLFPDMMVFPVREDGVLNGEVLVVPEDSCRSVYGLREMVRAVLRTPQYAQREEKKYQEYVDGMLERYPLATMVDSPDKTVVYFYDAEGRVFGSRRVSTVGNF